MPNIDNLTPISFGTSGTGAIGTLIAAPGAGVSTVVVSYTINVASGTPDVCLSFGTAQSGRGVVERGVFNPGGGVTVALPYPTNGGTTNAPLTYQILAGAGTVYWNVKYIIAP